MRTSIHCGSTLRAQERYVNQLMNALWPDPRLVGWSRVLRLAFADDRGRPMRANDACDSGTHTAKLAMEAHSMSRARIPEMHSTSSKTR